MSDDDRFESMNLGGLDDENPTMKERMRNVVNFKNGFKVNDEVKSPTGNVPVTKTAQKLSQYEIQH